MPMSNPSRSPPLGILLNVESALNPAKWHYTALVITLYSIVTNTSTARTSCTVYAFCFYCQTPDWVVVLRFPSWRGVREGICRGFNSMVPLMA